MLQEMAVDIIVRRGKARTHRVNAALDRLRERQSGPNPPASTRLRIVIEANLPRGQERPSRMEYQRIASWMIDCRTAEAVEHVRNSIRENLHQLRDSIVESISQLEETRS